MIDCLIIGFNDANFENYVDLVKTMGTESGAYRDLRLAFVEHNGRPHRSMDLLNHFYWENKGGVKKRFHNADFLWPVVTYLATYLSKRGFTFDYVNLPHLEREKLRDILEKNEVLTVAITTTLYVSPQPVIEAIAFVRECNPAAKIIVGGPYISNQPKMTDELSLQRLFKFLGADIYVISQEGEGALVEILTALKKGRNLDSIDNIAYQDGQKYVITNASVESNLLEENMIDYSLFPKAEIDEFVSVRTAKSCPFSCSFCGFPQRAGNYKYLTVELVEKELNAIRDLGTVSTITFLDDTFNVPKGRFREILRMMIRNKYGFKWNSFYRSDHGDERTIELMGKAGCEGVFLGVESGSDAMLERMNKAARRKDYLKSIPLLKQHGISTHANVIVGFPGETYETYLETIDLIEEAAPDFFRAQLWYADPVTPIWNKRDEYGVKGSSFNWSHNTMDYRAACDLVDRMFLSVKRAVWLPQNGFEQWSTFYLQRKGMTLEQIKAFLKCFNAIIKQSLIEPERNEIDSRLLENLRVSCKFDESDKPNLDSIEILSGSSYSAGEQYWIKEFKTQAPPGSLGLTVNPVAATDFKPATLDCGIEKEALVRLQTIYQDRFPLVGLIFYCLSLSQLRGSSEITLILRINDRSRSITAPFRLQLQWELSLNELVQRVERKFAEAEKHQLYAFHILTNPTYMANFGASCPVFEAGYFYSDSEEFQNGHMNKNRATGLESALQSYPGMVQEMGLILEVLNNGGELNMQLCYDPRRIDPGRTNMLTEYLGSTLKEIAENPDLRLDEIGCKEDRRALRRVIETDADAVFNF